MTCKRIINRITFVFSLHERGYPLAFLQLVILVFLFFSFFHLYLLLPSVFDQNPAKNLNHFKTLAGNEIIIGLLTKPLAADSFNIFIGSYSNTRNIFFFLFSLFSLEYKKCLAQATTLYSSIIITWTNSLPFGWNMCVFLTMPSLKYKVRILIFKMGTLLTGIRNFLISVFVFNIVTFMQNILFHEQFLTLTPAEPI